MGKIEAGTNNKRRQGRDPALTWDIPPKAEFEAPLFLLSNLTPSQFLSVSKDAFAATANAHLLEYVSYLFHAESAPELVPVIVSLAQRAASTLTPSQDAINPRSYVCTHHAKHSDPSESLLVTEGIVLDTSLLADGRMSISKGSPRVVVAARGTCLTALPPSEIIFTPDTIDDTSIIDSLIERGITLFVGVPLEVIDRVSGSGQSGNSKVEVQEFDSLEAMGPVCVLHERPVEQQKKKKNGLEHSMTLVIGTNNCSIEEEVLNKVIEFAVYVAYWNRLEGAFLSLQLLSAALSVLEECDVGPIEVRSVVLASQQKVTEDRRAQSMPLICPSPHVSPPPFFPPQDQGEDQRLMLHQATVTITGVSSASPLPSEPQGRESLSSHPPDDYQRLWLSISCKNPAKGIMCETPHPHSMEYYSEADMSLKAFLSAAAPSHRKCPHPQCGEGAAVHLRSFVHGTSLVTLSSAKLPTGSHSLLGDEEVWIWMRPLHSDADLLAEARRVSLCSIASCISFAHFLTLLLDARDLKVCGGRSLQRDFVLYIGCGTTLLCLHQSEAVAYDVVLPPRTVDLGTDAPSVAWLQDEIQGATEEADEAFTTLETIIHELLGTAEQFPKWQEDLKMTQSAVMDTMQAVISHVESDLAHMASVQVIVNSTWEVHRLRRLLAWVVTQWTGALGAGESPPQVWQHAGEDKVQGSQHIRDGSGSSLGFQFLTQSAVLQGAKEKGLDQVYSTPTLAPSSSSASSLASERLPDYEDQDQGGKDEDISDAQSIPTGLVARYVSFYEQQQDKPSADSREQEELGARRPSPSYLERASVNIDLSASEINGDSPLAIEHMCSEESSQLMSHFEAWKPLLAPPPGEVSGGSIDSTAPPPPLPPPPSSSSKDQLPAISALSQKPLPAKLGINKLQHLLSLLSKASGEDRDVITRHPIVLNGLSLLPPGAHGTSVTVFENEPTSVITFFLSSCQYREYLQGARKGLLPKEYISKGDETPSVPPFSRDALVSDQLLDCQLDLEHKNALNGRDIHLKLTAYFAPQFAEFRSLCIQGGEDAFLASLSRCTRWASRGGKTGVYFAKTKDDRYVIKQLSKSERQSFLEFAPQYLEYMGDAILNDQASCLTKVLGVFQVSVMTKSVTDGGGSSSSGAPLPATMDIIIMENIFYGRTPHRIYDLKGTDRERYMAAEDCTFSGAVLLDENLKEANLASPLFLTPTAHAKVQRALWADTHFLATLGVMDYSLLVGVDKERKRLTLGIIDFIRQYTWDKQVESWVKKTGILGGGAGKEPTVISPKQYCRRFRAAMSSYFSVVPGIEPPEEELDPSAGLSI